MHAFDILAESKMQQWEREERKGDHPDSSKTDHVGVGSYEPLEKALFRNIRRNIIKAYMATGEERGKLLSDAADMHVQLSSRLEKSGYNLMSKMYGEAIQAVRAAARADDGDTEKLQALLRDVD